MTTLDKRNTEIEEAAEYWDTHSVTDDNTEPVTEPIIVKKPLTSVFSIRLDQDDIAKLRALARANGIGPTTMARTLLRRSINDKHDADRARLITISTTDLDMALENFVESVTRRAARYRISGIKVQLRPVVNRDISQPRPAGNV